MQFRDESHRQAVRAAFLRITADPTWNTWTKPLGCHWVEGVNCITWPLSVTCVVPLTSVPFCDTWRPACTLEAFIASLMYNTTVEFSGTPVAPFPGRCDTTVGAGEFTAGPVVNWLSKLVNALPERSVIPLVARTVIVVETGTP